MAKGQRKSNREVRKPKKTAAEKSASAASAVEKAMRENVTSKKR
jgi:hypothetical protein